MRKTLRKCNIINSSANRCVNKLVIKKKSTTPFNRVRNPKVVFFIKPYDDEVLSDFITMIK